ncbi:MAG TPA: DUF1697 domain-containing protein [Methanobacterium sp.]|nr:DUF1697 domain-containing protein [Methanobacterium sp.]
MKYIALLRGINVGGKKRIKMADLVEALEPLGLENVKTYLQSGNVIFEYDSIDSDEIARNIEDKISQTFGISVNVIIRTESELERVINTNPFIKKPNIELDKLHVTFLKELPDFIALDLNKSENEKFEVIDREIYLYLPNGYGRTKLTNNIFEKKLKTTATTRNWKTTNKLFEMSKNR